MRFVRLAPGRSAAANAPGPGICLACSDSISALRKDPKYRCALLKYGEAAAWMAERSDRATWRVQLEEASAEWRRRHAAAPGNT
jgi:hypothetical protein